MKNVLVFGMTYNPGGMESVIMNYYRAINALGADIHFDFLANEETIAYEDEILKSRSKIYKITARSKNPKKYRQELKEFFAKHAKEYDAIWVNVCSLANIDYLIMAKKYGIARRIIHCHNSQNGDSRLRNILHCLNRMRIRNYATDFWTCSKDANKWFYGHSAKRNHITVINNAIDPDKYKFSEKARRDYRKKLGLDKKFVVGNVARFHFQKNQLFLLDIFKSLKSKIPQSVLVLVGDGDDRPQIERKIEKLGLTNDVILLGRRNDIDQLLCAFDVFVFPSIFEGFGIVALEAQSSNLPVIASKEVPRTVKVCNMIDFVSLDAPLTSWVDAIAKCKSTKRKVANSFISDAGYNIKTEAKKLAKSFMGDKS